MAKTPGDRRGSWLHRLFRGTPPESDKPSPVPAETAPIPARWTIFDELARMDETSRREVLRSHEEAEIFWSRDERMIKLRKRLDLALGALTLLEVDSQIGPCDDADALTRELQATTLDRFPAKVALTKLIQSPSFLHYCDAYLYFGVRFLGQRLLSAESAAQQRRAGGAPNQSNWRPFGLVTPPLLKAPQPIARAYFALQTNEPGAAEKAGLGFLDGFLDRPLDCELWLRGLLTTSDEYQAKRFETITNGLRQWINTRIDFYLDLAAPGAEEAVDHGNKERELQALIIGEKDADELGAPFRPSVVFNKSAYSLGRTRRQKGRARPIGGWRMTNPVAARCGLADVYWIARLLRASVSSAGAVRYEGDSWLHLLRFHALWQGDSSTAETLRQSEEILRAIFEYVCDLVQNAIAITTERVESILDPDAPVRSAVSKRWQYVRDDELNEIARQRARRNCRPEPPDRPPVDDGWSERVKTGETPSNLIGISLSGGGIRSATFNLGVLEGLQKLDLLRHVDYLSTVSGGGFIGSWLVTNVRRSVHWLGRVTDWSASIAHLRAYSSYLAPRTGVMSADTWTMVATWIRNTFFIQITGLVWLFALMLSSLGLKQAFQRLWPSYGFPVGESLLLATATLVSACVIYQLLRLHAVTTERPSTDNSLLQPASHFSSSRSRWVLRGTIYPAYVAAFCVASLFWRDASSICVCSGSLGGFFCIFRSAWHPWLPLLVFSLVALIMIAFVSLRKWAIFAPVVGALCTIVLYLCLCGIFYLDNVLALHDPANHAWIAYVITPCLVLFAYSLSIVLLIGFTGRYSSEAIREWWTRLGASLAIYPLALTALSAVAAFGPLLTGFLWQSGHNRAIKWGSVLSWAGTVIAGLFAGKSSKTDGESDKSPKLEILAVVGGGLFIVGGAILVSTLLYLLLVKIFGPDNPDYSNFLPTLNSLPLYAVWYALGATLLIGLLFSFCFEINIFGFSQFYRNRIVRCYLGATRATPGMRKPNSLTAFDFKDDLKLHKFHEDQELDQQNGRFRGPFPIINCSLNLGGSKDLTVKTRHSASFSLTPLHCGSDRPRVGYAPTQLNPNERFANGVMLGQAVAVSGAAVSPNSGYNTSPLVAFLLTMFNVRLGWWFPNPGRFLWGRNGLDFSIYYLTRELLGLADERGAYLNVSDGGHFENLGVYELVRRRCKVIIACDAECDERLEFGSLGRMIRLCETDFGAIIDLDVKSIRLQKDSMSRVHCGIGQIKYSNGSLGYLIYLKSSMTADEPVSVDQYRSSHPSFPHESTADQFFSEDQFESYRKLGQHIVEHSFRGTVAGQHPVVVAEKLADVLASAGSPNEAFLKHSAALNAMWEKFRQSAALHALLEELMGRSCPPLATAPLTACEEERCVVLELIQLMEDVFLDLRLDDFWEHPDNRGWAMLFMQWSRSQRFREVWNQSRRTFGIRFEHFCASRLGLQRDRPIARV